MKRLLWLIPALLLTTLSVNAAPAFVQSAKVNFAVSGTSACAYGSNVTIGNLLVVYANSNENTAPGSTATIADSQGNTWTLRLTQIPPASDNSVYVWMAVAKATGANTTTVTWTSALNIQGSICTEYSGANTFGQPAIGPEQTGTTTITSPSITTTQASSLLISVFRTNQPNVAVTTPFTQRQVIAFSASNYATLGDNIVGSTGTYTASATIGAMESATQNGAAGIASFYLGSTVGHCASCELSMIVPLRAK